MSSQAQKTFGDLLEYVNQLIAIHEKLQTGKGRRHEQDAIHRAGVVMIVAAWESYVEKIVLEALDSLENSAGVTSGTITATPVPAWAKHSFALRRAEIAKNIKRFNTPNDVATRDLLRDSLEFNPLPHWSWYAQRRQWDPREMRDRLNNWVLIRHSVAHGFPLPSDINWIHDEKGRARLTLTLLRECKKFFERLVAQTDQAFAHFLMTHHGILKPW